LNWLSVFSSARIGFNAFTTTEWQGCVVQGVSKLALQTLGIGFNAFTTTDWQGCVVQGVSKLALQTLGIGFNAFTTTEWQGCVVQRISKLALQHSGFLSVIRRVTERANQFRPSTFLTLRTHKPRHYSTYFNS
jgi:hypothetical protein